MMETLSISANVNITVTHTDPWNWPQHPNVAAAELPKFITYIGLNNLQKLSRIVSQTPYPIKTELREGRRMKLWRYELKIWGLSWADAQNLALKLDPESFDSSIRLEDVEIVS